MCRIDVVKRLSMTRVVAVVAMCWGAAAAAQSSFDQGSFGGGGSASGAGSGFGGSFGAESGSGATPPPPSGSGSMAPGGSFGGSFDDGGSFGPAAPDSQVVATPPGGDGGSLDQGSFGPGGGGAGQIPPGGGGDGQTSPGGQGVVAAPPPPPPQPPAVHPQILAFETQDFGVPPTGQLRSGQFHGPTPTVLPGGSMITTEALLNALNSGQQVVLIDVLGAEYRLPNAFQAPALSSPGGFQDRTQQQAAQWLQQITGGNPNVPIVVYCSDPNCWLSYNGALRAIAAGYSNVYWYRGGLQAWQMAGLPMQPSGF